MESHSTKIVEFIGYGGKTYTMNSIGKLMRLKKFKPYINYIELRREKSRLSDTFLDLFKIINKILIDSNAPMHDILETSIKFAQVVINSQNQLILFDEGIIKGAFLSIVEKLENYELELAGSLKNYAFVVIRPEISLAHSLYLKRNKIGISDFDEASLLKERIITLSNYVDKFINFMDNYKLSYFLFDSGDFNKSLEDLEKYLMALTYEK
jgi:hypothetical protein